MKQVGIYCIFNKKSEKRYIGQSRDIPRRLEDHKRALRKGKCHNEYFQRAWNADGEENFEFSVIELCDIEQLNAREVYWISYYDSMNPLKGYNLESGGNVGKEISEKTREAKRGANNPMYGKQLTEEHAEKIRQHVRGHNSKVTEEDVKNIKQMLAADVCAKEIAAKYGITQDAVHKIAIGENWGYVLPELNDVIKKLVKGHKQLRDAKICEMEQAGFSRAQIAKAVGCTQLTVTRVIGKRASYYRDSPQKEALKEAVIRDFEAGMSKADIVEKYGISESVYVRMTHDAYVEKQKKLHKEANRLRKNGVMVKDIAKQFGVSRLTITKWTKELWSSEYRENLAE